MLPKLVMRDMSPVILNLKLDWYSILQSSVSSSIITELLFSLKKNVKTMKLCFKFQTLCHHVTSYIVRTQLYLRKRNYRKECNHIILSPYGKQISAWTFRFGFPNFITISAKIFTSILELRSNLYRTNLYHFIV